MREPRFKIFFHLIDLHIPHYIIMSVKKQYEVWEFH